MKKKILILALAFFVLQCSANAKINKTKNFNNAVNYKKEYLNLNWWKNYNDDILIQHLQEVSSKNNDLKISYLKVKEGEKLIKISFANELPQVSFSPELQRTMESSQTQYGNLIIPNYAQNNFLFPVTMSYEADIWGENRDITKSIEKQVEMLKQDERASYISITTSFAISYYNLVKLDKLISLQEELVNTQNKIYNYVKTKNKTGLCPLTAVIDEEKTLHSLTETKNSLEDKRTSLLNEINVYLSNPGIENFTRINYKNIQLPPALPDGINSEIIEKRPDVEKAEANLQAVGFNVRASRKDLLPNFTIFGQLGLNAYEWGNLFTNKARLGSFGILPNWDIFTGGRKLATLKLRKLQYNEATEKYTKTIISSIQDINSTLATEKTMNKNMTEAIKENELELQKYKLISKQYKIGSGSDLETLFDKERTIVAEQNEVSAKINYIISTINLYKAVGGEDLYHLPEKI